MNNTIKVRATDADILAYLRHSYQIAEIAPRAELDALILKLCSEHEITVSEQELQTAGDVFRQEHKLLGAKETFSWLEQQRISVEDWSNGIRIALLTKKFKEYKFGGLVDAHYISNRNDYKRVALSQILVKDISAAMEVFNLLKQDKAAFCALALERSLGKQSKANGGFIGTHFVTELLPEIAAAIAEAKEGEIISPIQTQIGYLVIKIEKWFPSELNETVREKVIESLFEFWLEEDLKGEVTEKAIA